MIPISEHDFKLACQSGAVTGAEAVPYENGHILVLSVNWRPEKLTLFTDRKQPRVWPNLNTLLGFLKRQNSKIDQLAIKLAQNQPKR